MAQRETAAERRARKEAEEQDRRRREFEELVGSLNARSALEICDAETGEVMYTLQFNRVTVKRMDRDGFRISQVDDSDLIGSVTAIERMVCGAFEMHHPQMSDDERIEVWSEMVPDKDEAMRMLMALYMAPITALTKNPTSARAKLRLV